MREKRYWMENLIQRDSGMSAQRQTIVYTWADISFHRIFLVSTFFPCIAYRFTFLPIVHCVL